MDETKGYHCDYCNAFIRMSEVDDHAIRYRCDLGNLWFCDTSCAGKWFVDIQCEEFSINKVE
jgi:hypothetical protein